MSYVIIAIAAAVATIAAVLGITRSRKRSSLTRSVLDLAREQREEDSRRAKKSAAAHRAHAEAKMLIAHARVRAEMAASARRDGLGDLMGVLDIAAEDRDRGKN